MKTITEFSNTVLREAAAIRRTHRAEHTPAGSSPRATKESNQPVSAVVPESQALPESPAPGADAENDGAGADGPPHGSEASDPASASATIAGSAASVAEA